MHLINTVNDDPIKFTQPTATWRHSLQAANILSTHGHLEAWDPNFRMLKAAVTFRIWLTQKINSLDPALTFGELP